LSELNEHLPEDFDGKEALSGKFDSVAGLARSYQELEKSMGGRVSIPGAEASGEELAEFYQKIGKPETVDGYSTPEGMEEWANEARAIADAANLTAVQWEAFVEAQKAANESQQSMLGKSLEEGHTHLLETHGSKYEEYLELAKRGRDHLTRNEALSDMVNSMDLKNPQAYELLREVGNLMADDSSPNAGEAASDPETEMRAAAARIREILKGEEFTDRHHPANEKVTQEYYTLFAKLSEAGYSGASDPRLQPKYSF